VASTGLVRCAWAFIDFVARPIVWVGGPTSRITLVENGAETIWNVWIFGGEAQFQNNHGIEMLTLHTTAGN
jgi:hypothetical protein